MQRHHVPFVLFALFAQTLLSPLAAAQTATLVASKDNTIYEESGASNGSGQHLFSGRITNLGGPKRRSALAFDVAGSIPAGSVITSVQLRLVVTRTQTGTVFHELHRLTSDFGEGASDASGAEGQGTSAIAPDCTWSDSMLGTAWGTPGGDFIAVPSANGFANATGSQLLMGSTSQLVADVQDMLDNPGGDFGWLLLGDEFTNFTAKRFASRTNSTSGSRPRLTIGYTASLGTPFCFGVGCPCGNDSPTTGCLNSTGAGALLGASGGSTSVAADDLVLTTTGHAPLNSGLYFMGGATLAPISVGDGLACTGGLFRFFPGTVSGTGVFSITNLVAMAPPGQITSGDTRHFQSWTRDVLCGPPPTPCPTPCGNNSNLSNGYTVVFSP